jgi:CRP-like cAMP-binding protein
MLAEPLQLRADDIDVLRTIAVERSYSAGDVVCDPGNRPRGRFYLVAGGEAELQHETAHERVVLQLLRRGGVFGDVSGDGRIPPSFRTEARTDLRLLDVDLRALAILGVRHPQLLLRWARLLTRQVEGSYRRLAVLGTQTATQRLARHLLAEADEKGTVALTARQTDLAAQLAVSRQTISRTLAELASVGALERHRGGLLIVDRVRLARLEGGRAWADVTFEQVA